MAGELNERVRYGKEVVSVLPMSAGAGRCGCSRSSPATSRPAHVEELLTRNLVLATGGVPCAPEGIELQPGGRAFHSHESMLRLKRDFPDAEAPLPFRRRGLRAECGGAILSPFLPLQQADVTGAVRRFAYKPVDDSDFTNEIFFPEMVDFLYGLPEDKRQMVLDHCRDVNYAVVDMALIRKIYKALYQEKVVGRTAPASAPTCSSKACWRPAAR